MMRLARAVCVVTIGFRPGFGGCRLVPHRLTRLYSIMCVLCWSRLTVALSMCLLMPLKQMLTLLG